MLAIEFKSFAPIKIMQERDLYSLKPISTMLWILSSHALAGNVYRTSKFGHRASLESAGITSGILGLAS